MHPVECCKRSLIQSEASPIKSLKHHTTQKNPQNPTVHGHIASANTSHASPRSSHRSSYPMIWSPRCEPPVPSVGASLDVMLCTWQLWEHAIKACSEVMLDGFSMVRRCTMPGRSTMSLDLSHIENHFKFMTPTDVLVNLRIVDAYIKVPLCPLSLLSHRLTHHRRSICPGRTCRSGPK